MLDYYDIAKLKIKSEEFKCEYINEIPLFKTWLKDYPYSNISSDLAFSNNDAGIESISKLIKDHPKLIYPLTAAVSTAFCPFDNKAIFQFSTHSVAAKNLINFVVSVLYGKAYIYPGEDFLQPDITETFDSAKKYCRNWFIIHQLDKFDISREENLFEFFHAYSLDQYNDILYACSDGKSYPIDQHKSSILFTFDRLLTNYYPCDHCSFYEKVFYVNTIYGEEEELRKFFKN